MISDQAASIVTTPKNPPRTTTNQGTVVRLFLILARTALTVDIAIPGHDLSFPSVRVVWASQQFFAIHLTRVSFCQHYGSELKCRTE
jgi:hypothetical protein